MCIVGRYLLKLINYVRLPLIPVAHMELQDLEELHKFLLAEWPGAIRDEVRVKHLLSAASAHSLACKCMCTLWQLQRQWAHAKHSTACDWSVRLDTCNAKSKQLSAAIWAGQSSDCGTMLPSRLSGLHQLCIDACMLPTIYAGHMMNSGHVA